MSEETTRQRGRWIVLLAALMLVALYVSSYVLLAKAGRMTGLPDAYVFRYADNVTLNEICYYSYYPAYIVDRRLRGVAWRRNPPLASLSGTLAQQGGAAPADRQNGEESEPDELPEPPGADAGESR